MIITKNSKTRAGQIYLVPILTDFETFNLTDTNSVEKITSLYRFLRWHPPLYDLGPGNRQFFLTKVTRLSGNLTKVARMCEESMVV